MYTYPELTMLVATEYQRARVAEADQYRLLTIARRARRAARHRISAEPRAGTLAPCAPAAA